MMWFLQNYPFKLESLDPYLPEELHSETQRSDTFSFFREYIGQMVSSLQNLEGNKNMTDIKSMNKKELEELVGSLGEKSFRAKQIYSWLHEHLVTSYEEMTNLSAGLKKKLSVYPITALRMVDVQISRLDGTRKYLFQLADGNVIESVLMRYKHGNSVCISSQVGCRMGCRFCASTIGGLTRCLTPSEMLDQIYSIQKDTGERVSNVVVMGTGSPSIIMTIFFDLFIS